MVMTKLVGAISTSIDDLLVERGATHGNFTDTARAIQKLKRVMREEQALRQQRGQKPLTYKEAEALEMILHKAGRILSGDSGFPDHWKDIGGYAELPLKDI